MNNIAHLNRERKQKRMNDWGERDVILTGDVKVQIRIIDFRSECGSMYFLTDPLSLTELFLFHGTVYKSLLTVS